MQWGCMCKGCYWRILSEVYLHGMNSILFIDINLWCTLGYNDGSRSLDLKWLCTWSIEEMIWSVTWRMFAEVKWRNLGKSIDMKHSTKLIFIDLYAISSQLKHVYAQICLRKSAYGSQGFLKLTAKVIDLFLFYFLCLSMKSSYRSRLFEYCICY